MPATSLPTLDLPTPPTASRPPARPPRALLNKTLCLNPLPCPPAPAAGKHAARVMHTFTPQSIANMVWAYATLNECPDPAFFQVLCPLCPLFMLCVPVLGRQ